MLYSYTRLVETLQLIVKLGFSLFRVRAERIEGKLERIKPFGKLI